jgi:hypothetical protein
VILESIDVQLKFEKLSDTWKWLETPEGTDLSTSTDIHCRLLSARNVDASEVDSLE